ncbi:hypothetical protein NQD34_018194 [Periophthalmus magnuspinnatus]|nr:hypothetical protein NQD34_018194 [Periophthalmus magnuspinnatus]
MHFMGDSKSLLTRSANFVEQFNNKKRREKESTIICKIKEIDRLYETSPSSDLYDKRQCLQTELNLLYTSETTKLLTQLRHKYYEHGERVGRLLASQIKEQQASRSIIEVRTGLRQITTDPKEINDMFKQYYSKLYTSESKGDSKLVNNFFENLSIPQVSDDHRAMLEKSITLGEIKEAILKMQNSKAPGPDGYTVEFYKTFKDQISPMLLEVFNEALIRGLLPPSFYEASISLIHKSGKDPLEPSSYRPISLLNVDYKILAKILATRLENILPTVISQDQTGFIKDRHLFFNIRRLLNIIYTQENKNGQELLLSLDAEKAFDRVEWDYLFSALSKFGFGPTFVSLVKLLYVHPKASIRTNDVYSSYFPLGRSTRQGCPLSPLLFALAIEPLAIALKTNVGYSGIIRGEMEHKVSLYADDLLLYVSNSERSLPIIMSVLKDFGIVSGYKINFSKSTLFLIKNVSKQPCPPLNAYPFTVSDKFKYLGINVTQEFSGLFKQNFV